MNVVGNSLSNHARSDDSEKGEDEDDDEEYSEPDKLFKDEIPGSVMIKISNTVQHPTQRFRQKQMMLEELIQPVLGDSANKCHKRVMKYGTAKLIVVAVV